MLEGPEEVYIDFEDNPKGKYKVNIRDKAKTDEKLALRLKPVTTDHQNVLRIFIDTISYQRMYRRFKQTVPWLRENHWSKKKDVRVYEFTRLQSLLGMTLPNVFATYYGTMISYDKNADTIQPK